MDEDSLLNTRLANRYTLVRFIRKGGSCLVYEGVDERQGDRVAIKYFYDDETCGMEEEWFLDENKFYGALKGCPCLLQLLDNVFIDREQKYFMIFELMDGDLDTYIPSGSEEILSMMKQCLSCISYIHLRGYIHNDLRPANILYRKTGNEIECKIADLGCASNNYHVFVAGYFASPDIIDNWDRDKYTSPDIAFANDLWMLGVAFFSVIVRYSKKHNISVKMYDFFPYDPECSPRKNLVNLDFPHLDSLISQVMKKLLSLDYKQRKEAYGLLGIK
jgi:serine/threonine protein kinase